MSFLNLERGSSERHKVQRETLQKILLNEDGVKI